LLASVCPFQWWHDFGKRYENIKHTPQKPTLNLALVGAVNVCVNLSEGRRTNVIACGLAEN
jgi:hypothetical protein